MPGVTIKTSTKAGPTNPIAAPTSRAFIAGVTERGTLSAKSIRNIVQYANEYGTLQSYSAHMYRAAQTYFEEGGSELIVVRVVGTTPTIATLTTNDRAGTPLPTVKWDAANAGQWGAGLTVQTTAGTVANSVNVSAFLGGERVTYVTNLTTVADIATALAADPYLRATDLGSATTYPNRLPAIIAATPLVGGADDRATVTAAKVAATLDAKADKSWGAGAVAAPGYDATAIGALLVAHAKANRRIAILAGAITSIPSDLTTMAAALVADGKYAGVFGPWLTIPEGSATANVSPEGYVLGVRARAMNSEGFWQAAAGGRATARYVLGTYATYDGTVINTLADGRVNGITKLAGQTVLYGWRSATALVEQFGLLNAQDVMNALEELFEQALQPYVFETIDGTGQLVSRVKGALVGLLQPIEDAGGFTAKYSVDGDVINPAYTVDVSVLNETTISATAVIRLSGVAETIEVSIVKAAYNATI